MKAKRGDRMIPAWVIALGLIMWTFLWWVDREAWESRGMGPMGVATVWVICAIIWLYLSRRMGALMKRQADHGRSCVCDEEKLPVRERHASDRCPYEPCDEDCRARKEPRTPVEVQAALKHWRVHSVPLGMVKYWVFDKDAQRLLAEDGGGPPREFDSVDAARGCAAGQLQPGRFAVVAHMEVEDEQHQ